MTALRDLEPGTRFKLPDCGKTGVLVAVGAMGARVIYDGARRQVAFKVASTEQDVAFEAPGAVVMISDAALVAVLPHREEDRVQEREPDPDLRERPLKVSALVA